jgi:aspartate-semialdehyde dehydrogenase
MKVAVVGATGLVGGTMLRLLEERKFPVTELIPVASEKSVGKEIIFKESQYRVYDARTAISLQPDIALFSAGGETSLELAPQFAKKGTIVIDNSSAWRMHTDVKLIVPEINGNTLTKTDKIIANPNCSTIQLVMVLHPLHAQYKIRRVVVSTYQSVTGTGMAAVNQLMNERKGIKGEMAYAYPIDLNIIPQIDVFLDNDYTKEEMKVVNESKKILNDYSIRLTATAVRIPVIGGHSESVNIEFENPFEIPDIRRILSSAKGIIVSDRPKEKIYPMPIESHQRDDVFVGRIRKDESQKNTLNLWIVADNLRKGAATNAIQIAEHLLRNQLIQ